MVADGTKSEMSLTEQNKSYEYAESIPNLSYVRIIKFVYNKTWINSSLYAIKFLLEPFSSSPLPLPPSLHLKPEVWRIESLFFFLTNVDLFLTFIPIQASFRKRILLMLFVKVFTELVQRQCLR